MSGVILPLPIAKKKVLVIGDVMLDIYYDGDIDRISPEAPVPVFKYKSERYVLGGAANVASNLVAAGQHVSLLSVTGNDENGIRLISMLKKMGISTELTIQIDRVTTTKTRFLANNSQQVMRSDTEDANDIAEETEKKLLDALTPRISDFDIVVISDYKKGVLTDTLVRGVCRLADENRIKVLADIKENIRGKYNHLFLLKPNKKELASLTNIKLDTDEDIKRATEKLRSDSGCAYVLTTLGAKGMLLVGAKDRFEVPSVAREVYDVTGAGDTVISYLATCLANGMEIKDAVKIANIASGIEVGKSGTSQVSISEVETYISNEYSAHRTYGAKTLRDIERQKGKIYHRSDAGKLRESLKGKRVIFTNGCFDILHVGHIRYLNLAREMGDALIVAVNSDASVKRLKGEARPINGLNDRMELLAAMEAVDYVIPFDEDTPYEIISEILPDVIVKGGDYKPEDVVGKDIVEARGGEVIILPFTEDRSTTAIIEKLEG